MVLCTTSLKLIKNKVSQDASHGRYETIWCSDYEWFVLKRAKYISLTVVLRRLRSWMKHDCFRMKNQYVLILSEPRPTLPDPAWTGQSRIWSDKKNYFSPGKMRFSAEVLSDLRFRWYTHEYTRVKLKSVNIS